MNSITADLGALTDSIMRAAALVRRVRRADGLPVPGLEPFHTELLDRLGRGPARITHLAEEQGEDLSTVSRRISRLVQFGLVAKGVDPDDRRAQVVQLTPQGEQAMERLTEGRRDVVRDMFSSWQPEELAQLERLMDKLGRQLQQD